MTQETWQKFAAPDLSLKGRVRKAVRDRVLSASAIVAGRPGGNFLRPLYCHYVFDEQRGLFERKMRQALDWGEFVTTRDAVAMVTGDVPIDGRYFHLSFDDGLHCLLRNAAPILAALEIPSISFINSALAGDVDAATEQDWRKATNYRGPVRVMDWEELREIQFAGMEIGAHSRTHKRLSEISGDRELLENEIAGCKADIEANLGEECRYFAWPFGTKTDIDHITLEAVKAAGFEACFGVFRERIVPGETDPFQVPRHHFEPHWPHSHFIYFAGGGRET